jgi:hypothetical protein
MSVVTVESILQETQVDDPDIALNEVFAHRRAAEARMRRILTFEEPEWDTQYAKTTSPATGTQVGDLYEEIVAENDPYGQEDLDDLTTAETMYCYGEALPFLSLKQTDDGGFVQATGFDQSRVNYVGQDEIGKAKRHVQTQAVRIAESIKPVHDKTPTWVL